MGFRSAQLSRRGDGAASGDGDGGVGERWLLDSKQSEFAVMEAKRLEEAGRVEGERTSLPSLSGQGEGKGRKRERKGEEEEEEVEVGQEEGREERYERVGANGGGDGMEKKVATTGGGGSKRLRSVIIRVG